MGNIRLYAFLGLVGFIAFAWLYTTLTDSIATDEALDGVNIDQIIPDAVRASPVGSELNLEQIEMLIHENANAERQKAGVHPLEWDSELAAVAKAHSKDMAARDFFDHVNPDGKDHRDRYAENGIRCFIQIAPRTFENGSENLMTQTNASRYAESRLAQSAVDAWLASTEGHRENMLSEDWTSGGVGVAISSDDTFYVTHNFC